MRLQVAILLLQFISYFSYARFEFTEGYCIANHHDAKCKTSSVVQDSLFRAAVLEHDRIDLSDGMLSIAKNLDIFREAAKLASDNGADIIVFPEDGIFMGTIRYVRPLLTELPDPERLKVGQQNPCESPELFVTSDILRNLSCIARDNHIYVTANFGTKESCQPGSNDNGQICPEIGYRALNTDVVFDSKGNFIKRYRKYNLFLEIFDETPSLEVSYFDSPFGRIGVFTCFDMIFRRPAIELVEELEVDTVLYPTWWYDELPLLSAIQYQNAWSWTNSVNLLAANMHRPRLGSTGSGIFSDCGSTYTGADAKNPRLLISSLPKKPSLSSCPTSSNRLVIDLERNNPTEDYNHKHYQLIPSDTVHQLISHQGEETVCSGRLCCIFRYKMSRSNDFSKLDRMIFIVRDGLRTGPFKFFEQVCALATLREPFNPDKLDKITYSTEGLMHFEDLNIEGKFNTDYVYPVMAYNVSNLIERKDVKFVCSDTEKEGGKNDCSLRLRDTSAEKEIYSFGLYGRVYNEDQMARS